METRRIVMRTILGWLIWAAVTVGSGYYLIDQASTVKPSESGLEFYQVRTVNFLNLGLLALVATGFVAGLATRKRFLQWITATGLTFAVGIGIQFPLHDIEFERTPPCWGMHSREPGSGASCPPGMKQDFTVAELREYYRNRR